MEGIGSEEELNFTETDLNFSKQREIKNSNSVIPSWLNKSDKLGAIKNSFKETLKIDTPFKLFRSKLPGDAVAKSKMYPDTRYNKTNSDSNLPSLCVNGDFIEVTLNDDGVDGNETATSFDERSLHEVQFRDDTLLSYSSPLTFNGEKPNLSSDRVSVSLMFLQLGS